MLSGEPDEESGSVLSLKEEDTALRSTCSKQVLGSWQGERFHEENPNLSVGLSPPDETIAVTAFQGGKCGHIFTVVGVRGWEGRAWHGISSPFHLRIHSGEVIHPAGRASKGQS